MLIISYLFGILRLLLTRVNTSYIVNSEPFQKKCRYPIAIPSPIPARFLSYFGAQLRFQISQEQWC
jgi:hypothetical protein